MALCLNRQVLSGVREKQHVCAGVISPTRFGQGGCHAISFQPNLKQFE